MRIAVIAGVIVVVLVGAFLGFTLLGNSETKITWEIENECTESKTVRIGNFRTAATGGPNDCSVEGSEWPFGEDDDKPLSAREREVGPNQSKKIKQRTAINNGTTPLEYYFDVCVGGAKVDPKLIVDP